jgi:glyoxylate reductase
MICILLARVLVTRRLPGDHISRLAAEHQTLVWGQPFPPPPDALRESLRDAEGLLCMLTERIDEEMLDAAPRLRVVSNYAVGTDNIDLEACRARGIAVGRTPGVLTDATADLTMALMLAIARRLPDAAQSVVDGGWKTWEPEAFLGLELRGAKLLIVGGGRIGQAVAERAHAFGMLVRVAGRDDPLPFERADVVSLHCPLTEQTRGMIDADVLRRMKPTALLVNTARGGLVDTDALTAALEAGEIAGAALDVTDPEPLPAGHPLLRAPNALVVPHIGSATTKARTRMSEMAVDNVLAGLAGQPLPNPA